MRRLLVTLTPVLVLAACDNDRPTPVSPDRPQVSASASASARLAMPGEYIVMLDPSTTNVRGRALALVSSPAALDHVYSHAIKGFSARLSPAQADALRRVPGVQLVEENQVMQAIAVQMGATWGIDRVDQLDLPLSTTYVYNATGAGVNAYIIDTGIRTTHSEFGVPSRATKSAAADFIGGGQNGNDCNGHGTHVAGTVGGASYGVAKNVNLFAVRVLDCGGSGSTAGVIAGIDWVTANHVKPAVANMSLGGGASATLDQAVRNSIAAGVTYALAAGNGDFFGTPIDACTRSPARTAEALTVGSTTISDAESSFSNYGTCVDILAPGSSITSAWYTSDVATNTISGTSMATPHVAGAAALYLQGTPTATPAAVATALKSNGTANTITLHSRSRDRGTPNLFLYTGFISAGPPPPPPPAPAAPSALAATAAGASQVNLSWVDNSTNEDNFRIERCTGAGCTAFVEVATVGANVTTFSNTGLAASTSFSYRVRASNAGGNSAYSNTASATTAAAAADAPPVARYTWTCSDQDCDFDATTSSDDKGISRFDWNFGDGRTDTGQRSNNEYDAPAFYTVTLKVTDTAGKTTTIGCRVKAGSDLAGPSSGTCAP